MCKFLSKSGGVPFQSLGDLTWNDPLVKASICRACTFCHQIHAVKTEEVAKKLRQLNCCYLCWTLWMI